MLLTIAASLLAPETVTKCMVCRKWVSNTLAEDPEYFSRWAASQKPQHLWIGCSDSRVVAEAATGLKVGDVFVHRNVGNVLSHSDNNAMSALEFSVKVCLHSMHAPC